jgi:hypothetical protein
VTAPTLWDPEPDQGPGATLAERNAADRTARNAALAREGRLSAGPDGLVVEIVIAQRGPRGGDVELVNAAGDTQPIAGPEWCPSIRRRSLGYACLLLGARAGAYTDPYRLTHGWQPIDPDRAASQRLRVRPCTKCGAPIVFLTHSGRRGIASQMAVDVATADPGDTEFRPGRHRRHFATCPKNDAPPRGRQA